MSVARMVMVVGKQMTGANVTVIVGMGGHADYSTRPMHASQPARRLLGNLTRPFREWIDAPPGGCDHETSFPLRVCWRGTMVRAGDLRSAT